MRRGRGVRSVQVSGMENLYGAMERFQRGEARLQLLFRHVAVADGPLIVKIVSVDLPRYARQHGKPLPGRAHAHFLYGKDVLNWAGALARVFFPRVGGIPVVNGRVDRESQLCVRRTLTQSEFPLALAPEGQVTYLAHRTARLTQGAGTLARWAHTDLKASGKINTRVELLPVAIAYSYGDRAGQVLRDAVSRVELALFGPRTPTAAGALPDSAHLLDLTGRVLDSLEQAFPFRDRSVTAVPAGEREENLQTRITRLLGRTLQYAEGVAGVPSDGTAVDRVFRLRSWAVHSMHREDVKIDELSDLDRGMANRRAVLGKAAKQFEEIADVLEYLEVDYICGSGSEDLDRRVEYALVLLDLVNRICGGNIDSRFEPGERTAQVVFGDVIDASGVLEGARSEKTAVAEINSLVRSRFDDLVTGLEAADLDGRASGDA